MSLLVLALVVHDYAFAAEPLKAIAGQQARNTGLPAPVAEMREMLLAAVDSGKIEDLKLAFDWNELPPDTGAPDGADPIVDLKKRSSDGEGREILAILGNILNFDPAILPLGKDPENNPIYVWPALAEMPLDKLTPSNEVALLRLMPSSEAKALKDKKKWSWWRLAIGADGTLHMFKKLD